MSKGKNGYVTKTTTYNGKRYYVYGKTERDAAKKLLKLKVELETTGEKIDGNMTVKAWSERWVDVYVKSRDITEKSISMYQQKLDNHILPEIGSMRLCDVKDIHLKRMINHANSSYSTAQKVRVVTQAMFKQARKSRLIPFDPSEDLELPKAPKGKRKSITDAERQNILELAKTHRSGLYVLLLLYTGLRPGEAIALQWKDIDFKERTISVTKASESGNSRTIKEPKTEAGKRTLPIPEALYDRLKREKRGAFDYVLLQPLGKKRHTESSINDAWNNFKRHLDIQMGAEVYRNQIKKHCWEVNWQIETKEQWKALVPYSLRHTYCTDLQRAGVPINVAKYLMGHSDIAVTGNIYTDTTPDVIKSAVTMLDDLHSGKPKKDLTEGMEEEAAKIAN